MNSSRPNTLTRSAAMAEAIAKKTPLTPEIKEAFAAIPRELFIPEGFGRFAYELDALPMAGNQWISSPLTVAKMTTALELSGADSVLEIGCGSGYQAAILSKLVRRVFTIERIEKLLLQAKSRFKSLNLININARLDDGQKGWGAFAPYDRILFSASANTIPPILFDQLASGGILVAPVEENNQQIITQFRKIGRSVTRRTFDSCRFVPVLDGIERS